MKKSITELFDKISEEKSGKVADYIPELGCVDPDLFGVAVCTVDGQVFTWGDCDVSFPIQSCGKPFIYSYALEDYGEEHVRDFLLKFIGWKPTCWFRFIVMLVGNHLVFHLTPSRSITRISRIMHALMLVLSQCQHFITQKSTRRNDLSSFHRN